MKPAIRKECDENQPEQAVAPKHKGPTDKQVIKFIKHLRSKYPLQEDITIQVYLIHGILEIDGKQLHGQVCREKGNSTVYMQINTDQHIFLIYKTIAHEYRHIMQWINQGMEWITLSNEVIDKEIDAHSFAQRVIRDYCYPKHLRS